MNTAIYFDYFWDWSVLENRWWIGS